MNAIHAIVLGVVQGLTEFLPVSSTAHLVLLPWWLGWPDPGLAFDVALHLGTLLAVCAYFRADLGELLGGAWRLVRAPRAALREPAPRLVWLLGWGTLPAVVAGLWGRRFVASTLRDPTVVALALISVAIVILAAERRGEGERDTAALTLGDALLIGLAQASALVPGVSRSGATIGIGLVIGLRRPEAVRFSFLLGIPAIAGACVLEAGVLAREGFGAAGAGGFALGVLAAALSGYGCIAWLMRWVRRHGFTPFMLYRIAIGALTLWLAWRGAAPAVFGG